MPRFEDNNNSYSNSGVVINNEKTDRKSYVTGLTSSGALSFAKVFLYMFIYLAITAAVAFALGFAFTYLLAQAINSGDNAKIVQMTNIYYGVMIGSAIMLIIMMLVINFVVLRNKHSVLVPSIIYAVLVGVLFSSLTIFVDWEILGMAFGITAGVFLLMSIIALLTKGNLAPLGMVGIGLLLGSAVIVIVNLILRSGVLYWVISFVIFAAIMFITMFDIWNIKKICENGQMDKNLSYYCAFNMYVDFINVFIRIVYFLLVIFGSKK